MVLIVPGRRNGWEERALLVDERPDHACTQQLRQLVAEVIEHGTVGQIVSRILREKTLFRRNLEISERQRVEGRRSHRNFRTSLPQRLPLLYHTLSDSDRAIGRLSTVRRWAVSEDLLEIGPPFEFARRKITRAKAARFGGQLHPFFIHGAFLGGCRRQLWLFILHDCPATTGSWRLRIKLGCFWNRAKTLLTGLVHRCATSSRHVGVHSP